MYISASKTCRGFVAENSKTNTGPFKNRNVMTFKERKTKKDVISQKFTSFFSFNFLISH